MIPRLTVLSFLMAMFGARNRTMALMMLLVVLLVILLVTPASLDSLKHSVNEIIK